MSESEELRQVRSSNKYALYVRVLTFVRTYVRTYIVPAMYVYYVEYFLYNIQILYIRTYVQYVPTVNTHVHTYSVQVIRRAMVSTYTYIILYIHTYVCIYVYPLCMSKMKQF